MVRFQATDPNFKKDLAIQVLGDAKVTGKGQKENPVNSLIARAKEEEMVKTALFQEANVLAVQVQVGVTFVCFYS